MPAPPCGSRPKFRVTGHQGASLNHASSGAASAQQETEGGNYPGIMEISGMRNPANVKKPQLLTHNCASAQKLPSKRCKWRILESRVSKPGIKRAAPRPPHSPWGREFGALKVPRGSSRAGPLPSRPCGNASAGGGFRGGRRVPGPPGMHVGQATLPALPGGGRRGGARGVRAPVLPCSLSFVGLLSLVLPPLT